VKIRALTGPLIYFFYFKALALKRCTGVHLSAQKAI
jgi:hypothetical protein